MNFDHLAALSEEDFETEKSNIIRNFILSAPEEHRRKLYATQLQLEVRRLQMPHDQYMASLFSDMTEQLENLSDQFVALGHLVGIQPVTAKLPE